MIALRAHRDEEARHLLRVRHDATIHVRATSVAFHCTRSIGLDSRWPCSIAYPSAL